MVICPPFGQEYIRCHRSLLQLATRVALEGIPALRFDYFGCGDSAGDADSGSLARWLIDVERAVDEMKRRSGATFVCLAGVRLGATLAAMVARRRTDESAIALWDPISKGSSYLEELDRMQKGMLRHIYARRQDAIADERMGFPLGAALRAEISGIDLVAAGVKSGDAVLLVESGGRHGHDRLRSDLASQSLEFTHHRSDQPGVWLAEPYQEIVPHRVIDVISRWITQVSR